ncbi:MAG: hypothetical protein HXS46_20155 [Theionarchaea archaeon]|nr:hypothetical protein [Theionarchaea archaeon]
MGNESRSKIRDLAVKIINGKKEKENGEIKKMRFTVLESGESSEENIIEIFFLYVLALFTNTMELYYNLDRYEIDDDFEILEMKTAKYESAKYRTFANIVIKVGEKKVKEVEVESFLGKAVGLSDKKNVEILFENGFVTDDMGMDMDIYFQEGIPINPPLDIQKCKKLYEKVIETADKLEKAGELKTYKKFSSLNKILSKFEISNERYKASIKVLLNQYNVLRSEITQSIYLEQAAIIVLYTFLGVAVAYLLRKEIEGTPDLFEITHERDLSRIIPFLAALTFAQVIVCGIGSLFLREQARNRRACSFQKAIEYIINRKIGETGIYWENYITSPLIEKKIGFWNHFKPDIPINREYYKNRLLGIGLPIALPNLFVTVSMLYMVYASLHIGLPIALPNPLITVSMLYLVHASPGNVALAFYVFLIISSFITIWACLIMRKSCFPLKEEFVPSREEALHWIEKENRKLL